LTNPLLTRNGRSQCSTCNIEYSCHIPSNRSFPFFLFPFWSGYPISFVQKKKEKKKKKKFFFLFSFLYPQPFTARVGRACPSCSILFLLFLSILPNHWLERKHAKGNIKEAEEKKKKAEEKKGGSQESSLQSRSSSMGGESSFFPPTSPGEVGEELGGSR